MTCPVCNRRFEFAVSGSDAVPWPPDSDLPDSIEDQFEVDERTPSGKLEVCRDEPPRDDGVTYYVHLPDQ